MSDNPHQIIEGILDLGPVMPVIVIDDAKDALPLADALLAGGLKTIEITLRTLGTSSGAGKTLMTAALCRVLKRQGEQPLPFKGQNMSNNAWVDGAGGEMAYSQAMQAWAAGEQTERGLAACELRSRPRFQKPP